MREVAAERWTTCKVCGEEIFFIRCFTGERVPLEAEPLWIRRKADGDLYFRRDGEMMNGEPVGDAFDDPEVELMEVYRSHYVECPEGGRPRRKRERKRRTVG